MELSARVACGVLSLLVACAAPARPAVLPSLTVLGADGGAVDLRALASAAPVTVVVFFSRECHCLLEHEARLRELHEAYRARGVQIVMIDSEPGGSPGLDAAEAARRAYPFPILVDPGGRLAAAVDARYATYSLVIDRSGAIRYRGGLDSDRTHLRDDATMYVRDAVDDLLAGRTPRVADTKALGCSLGSR